MILITTHPKEKDRRTQLSQLQADSKLARQRLGSSSRDRRDVGDEDGDHGDVGEDESFVGWGPSFRVGYIMSIWGEVPRCESELDFEDGDRDERCDEEEDQR